MSSSQDRTPVWLDVDTGHDDVFAIVLAAHHPELKLLGISTTHGNARLADTTNNTSRVLTAIGQTGINVYPGAVGPFCRSEVFTPEIHGSTGLDGTTLLPPALAPIMTNSSALVAARNALMAQPPDSAWVVATGPLTNIALLFTAFPEVAEHIAGLSIMGGAVGGKFTGAVGGKTLGQSEGFGNETPWAEFNIYVDPEAARSIFSSPTLASKTTLITLDLTHQCLATKPVRQSLLFGSDPSKQPSQLRRLLNEILEFFAGTYDEFFDIKAGPPLHDPLAVAVLFGFEKGERDILNPPIFEDENDRYRVSVVTAGEHSTLDAVRGQVGRTIVERVQKTDKASVRDQGEVVGVRIPRKLNVEAFWRVVEECCSRAEDQVGS